MGHRQADRIYVYTNQWGGETWHQAEWAEWLTKSDGRPKALMCTFPGGWTSKVALTNAYSDTRNIIHKLPIKVTPRMLAQGCDTQWEFSFFDELIRMGEDNRDDHPPPAPYDDDPDDVFIDDGDDDP